jgi:hypothetical protein
MTYITLNPCGEKQEVQAVPMTPRLPDLKDKVVYCISQFVGGADTFLSKVAEALPQHAPGVKTVYKRKPSAYGSDDPELWTEIKEKGDAIIYGCGA